MADVNVTPVRGWLDRRAFMQFAWKLYAHDPYWVPPLRGDFKKLVGWKKHPFQKIGEIGSYGGKLRGVIKIKNGPKALPGYAGSQMPMMRYFEGYDQQKPGSPVWPPDKTALLPGPTLRVGVGERVEITFLNQTDVGAFPGGSIDRAERWIEQDVSGAELKWKPSSG